MNCCVAPAVILAVAGVTAMELTVFAAAVTVSAAVPAVPLRDAVIVDEPAAAAVTMPPALMLATEVLELVQVAVEVTSAVKPVLYVAVAVNCCVVPAAMLGDAGVTAMDVTVALLMTTPPPQPVQSAITANRRDSRPADGENL